MDIQAYWNACIHQDAEAMRSFFQPDAYVNWHNTGEHFTVSEFIRANCEYPGDWDGEIQRVEELGELVVTVVHVFSGALSFHVASFIRVREGKIAAVDEYWGDDGPAPQWRQDLKLGTRIS